uniref:Uncharacterized protein n=1 Tax=viral metagenome TaxID=1070528 RepID=A0A6C0I7F4_9ZZZZ
MDISIGSYKCRLEIVLIIIFLLMVLFGHTMCACSTGGLIEGAENMNLEDALEAERKEKERLEKGKMEGQMDEEINVDSSKEGFANYKTNAGPQFASTSSSFSFLNPDTWSQPSLVYTAGTAPSAGVKSIWDRGKNQQPLAEGEMDVFANTEFKPECCPNTYSNSQGCACMSTEQYSTLISRGGNNVPYSEY